MKQDKIVQRNQLKFLIPGVLYTLWHVSSFRLRPVGRFLFSMQIHINKLKEQKLSKILQFKGSVIIEKRCSMQRYANFLIMNGVESKGNGTWFELAGSSRVTRVLSCQVQQTLKGWAGARNTPTPLFAWWR